MIVAQVLTDSNVDDSKTGIHVLDALEGDIGMRRWKKESGYHRQVTVENAFFRYKAIVGDRLRARHVDAQKAEALIACNILNRMTDLGRPASVAVAS
jgi:hypothetical protein